MKRIFALAFTFIMLLTLVACGQTFDDKTSEQSSTSQINTTPTLESTDKDSSDGNASNMINVSVIVGDSIFSAKLYDSESSRALAAQFPITLDMSDLNGNEKYFYLSDDLPSKSTEQPAVINSGDIMCWSGNCLVLFYKTFSNSYGGYVRLGYVEDASGLAATLGSGSVQVTFVVF